MARTAQPAPPSGRARRAAAPAGPPAGSPRSAATHSRPAVATRRRPRRPGGRRSGRTGGAAGGRGRAAPAGRWRRRPPAHAGRRGAAPGSRPPRRGQGQGSTRRLRVNPWAEVFEREKGGRLSRHRGGGADGRARLPGRLRNTYTYAGACMFAAECRLRVQVLRGWVSTPPNQIRSWRTAAEWGGETRGGWANSSAAGHGCIHAGVTAGPIGVRGQRGEARLRDAQRLQPARRQTPTRHSRLAGLGRAGRLATNLLRNVLGGDGMGVGGLPGKSNSQQSPQYSTWRKVHMRKGLSLACTYSRTAWPACTAVVLRPGPPASSTLQYNALRWGWKTPQNEGLHSPTTAESCG